MKLFRKLVVLVIIILGIFFLKGNITGMSILDVKNIDMPDINLGEMGLDDIGIGNNDKKVEIKTVNENINTPDIYFCPKHNCSAVMVDLIKDAKKSVHCALFDLDLIELIEVLDEKYNEIDYENSKSNKIDVKVVVDNDNYEEIEESYGKDLSVDNNGFVKVDNNNQLTHNKFCIVDNKYVTSGSFNPTINGNNKNNNNLVVVQSYYLAENYEDEFNELWDGYFGKSNKNKQEKVKYPRIESNNELVIENYFCPDDNCEEHVLDVLENAKESVKFMIFSFTSDPIGDKLIEMHNNGIIIEGVVEKKQNTNKYSEYDKLKNVGIDIQYDNNKYNMHHKNGLQTHYPKSGLLHHKVFIIDDHIVITGSYNPTASGTEKNDENILIIYSDDVASEFVDEYDMIKK